MVPEVEHIDVDLCCNAIYLLLLEYPTDIARYKSDGK